MTDQQINEAIESFVFDFVPTDSNVPNYCNDLNAIVPVVAQLTGDSIGLFEHYLGEITGTDALALRRSFVGERFKLTIATARQLCEAFLRTVGNRKEVE